MKSHNKKNAIASILGAVDSLESRNSKSRPITLKDWVGEIRELGELPERPKDDVIIRYLLGVADESEERVMMQAMLNSDSFLRQMVEMARDLLDEEQGPDSSDSSTTSALPRPRELRAANDGSHKL